MLRVNKINPRYTSVLVTGDIFEEDYKENGFVISSDYTKGKVKPWQKVIAVGSMVKDIKPGDMVMISFERYRKRKIPVNSVKSDMDIDNPIIKEFIPYVYVEDKPDHTVKEIMLDDRDILYTFEGKEVAGPPQSAQIITPSSKIIL